MNPHEAEVKETKPDPESVTEPVAPEPEPHPEPRADLDLQTDDHDLDQEVPVSSTPELVPAQGQVSTDAPAEIFSDTPAAHPGLDSIPATSQDEAENTPTSQSASQTHTG